jgi:asparagine synthase (glutamine-hydrolysing)
MPKGLHALAEVPYSPDEQLMAEWLVLMPRRGPRAFFKDIARVEPAHLVTVTRDGVSSRRYWQPQRASGGRLQSSDYVEGVRHHVDQAVQGRLRGIGEIVGSQLSAGLDSGAVTATAARLLAPRGGKVVAFTAVPRAGYNGPVPRNEIGDEGPLAGATAALYPNVEHVLVPSGRQSPLDGLDRAFYLYERPVLNLSNFVWLTAINESARERKLNIMLIGTMGNMTVSYSGVELLPELLLRARFIRLWREGRHLVENAGMSPRGVLINILGAFMPVRVWQWVERRTRGSAYDVLNYTSIRAECMVEHNLAALARQRDLDFSYRPWKDGFASRLWAMNRIELAELNKGTLAGWGIDYRDPLADKRLVEYCLGVPTDQYLANGVPRALARRAFSDRLPQAVVTARKRGYQAADWHERLTAARLEVAAELDRLGACALAAKALDISKMKRLVENWPNSGWERDEVEDSYNCALLRGISAGYFLRKASGAN